MNMAKAKTVLASTFVKGVKFTPVCSWANILITKMGDRPDDRGGFQQKV